MNHQIYKHFQSSLVFTKITELFQNVASAWMTNF